MNEGRVDVARVSRRRMFQAAGALAVASAGGSVLAACSGSDDAAGTEGGGPSTGAQSTDHTSEPTAAGSTGSSAGGGGVLPTFTAFTPVKPDMAGDAQKGIPDAYLAFPESPVKVHNDAPAPGDPISVLKLSTNKVAPSLGDNKWWQELNKRVGADMKITGIISSDYSAKVATTVAGGDLPDLMQMQSSYVSNLEQFLTTTCQDLSEWLSGDAAKQFKALAGFPTVAWKNVVFKGGIYAVPYPLGVTGGDNKVRLDIADALGVSTEPGDGQEFLDMCKKLTDPAKKRWAIDRISTAQAMVNEAVGAPNSWRVQDGKFTSAWETDEYKQGLDICNQLWSAGCIYPDSLSSTANFHQWFTSGQTVLMRDGFTNWNSLTTLGLQATKDFRIGGVVVPKWEGGGQAAHYQGSGAYTFTVMKKQSSKAAVERLLTLLDWFATPYGSEEYLFNRYGIADWDYKLQGTDPVPTDAGTNESIELGYIATSPVPLYATGRPEVTKTDYTYVNKLMQVSEPLPTVGLSSTTNLTKGPSLNKPVNDAVNDIVTGRKKVSAWDGVVKTWKSNGGDQIAKEYSEAYSAAQGS